MWLLKTKIYVLVCGVLISGLYLAAWTGMVRLFLIFFALSYTIFAVLTFLYLGGRLFKILPVRLREFHSRRPRRYFALLLIPVAVFLLALLFSRSFAPYQRGIAHFLGLTGILIFSVFLLWCVLGGTRRKIGVIGMFLFAIYLILVTGWASTMKKIPRESTLEELAALPYVGWASTENSGDRSGVTLLKAEKASPGINLYAPNHAAEAFLIDMKGKVLHKWKSQKDTETWSHVALSSKGDLLAIYKDRQLTRLGWDSSVKWRRRGRFHHDARFARNGDVYALKRNDEVVFHHFLPVPVLNDYLVFFSADGKIMAEYSLFEHLRKYVPPERIFKIYRHLFKPKRLFRLVKGVITGRKVLFPHTSSFDAFHTNSIELVESRHPIFLPGDLLISMRNLSLVAVFDPRKRVVKWETDQLTMQHQPSFLPDGNILIFDNRKPSTKSRIVELDPRTKKLVWEYKAQDFYAYNRGGTQRLPNGNTLITESPDGRAFEVTPKGEIVWEFYTSLIRSGKRAVIYRLMRYSESDGFSCLKPFFSTS